LKQSSRIWNKRFTTFLKEFQLQAATADGCVYLTRTKSCLLITLFVDDGMTISYVNNQVTHILSFMGDAFHITTGYSEFYVGLHIVRDRQQRLIHIDLERYILAKLRKYGFDN